MKAWSEHGVSLIEATIVMAVFAVLSAVMAPAIQGYVERSRQAGSQSNFVCSVITTSRRASLKPQETHGKRPRQASIAYFTFVVACRPAPTMFSFNGSRAIS